MFFVTTLRVLVGLAVFAHIPLVHAQSIETYDMGFGEWSACPAGYAVVAVCQTQREFSDPRGCRHSTRYHLFGLIPSTVYYRDAVTFACMDLGGIILHPLLQPVYAIPVNTSSPIVRCPAGYALTGLCISGTVRTCRVGTANETYWAAGRCKPIANGQSSAQWGVGSGVVTSTSRVYGLSTEGSDIVSQVNGSSVAYCYYRTYAVAVCSTMGNATDCSNHAELVGQVNGNGTFVHLLCQPIPTPSPTATPTAPTAAPTWSPTLTPTSVPTGLPTTIPSHMPTAPPQRTGVPSAHGTHSTGAPSIDQTTNIDVATPTDPDTQSDNSTSAIAIAVPVVVVVLLVLVIGLKFFRRGRKNGDGRCNIGYVGGPVGEETVLISYCSRLNQDDVAETGLEMAEKVTGALRKEDITFYYGKMCPAGKSWKIQWFGRVESCKVAIVMLSRMYFESEPCIRELTSLLTKAKDKIIPVIVGEGVGTALRGDFCRSFKDGNLTSNFIRTELNGNWLPPPEKGLFGDDEGNIGLLMDEIREQLAPRTELDDQRDEGASGIEIDV